MFKVNFDFIVHHSVSSKMRVQELELIAQYKCSNCQQLIAERKLEKQNPSFNTAVTCIAPRSLLRVRSSSECATQISCRAARSRGKSVLQGSVTSGSSGTFLKKNNKHVFITITYHKKQYQEKLCCSELLPLPHKTYTSYDVKNEYSYYHSRPTCSEFWCENTGHLQRESSYTGNAVVPTHAKMLLIVIWSSDQAGRCRDNFLFITSPLADLLTGEMPNQLHKAKYAPSLQADLISRHPTGYSSQLAVYQLIFIRKYRYSALSHIPARNSGWYKCSPFPILHLQQPVR